MLLFTCYVQAEAAFTNKLKPFANYLGTWEATFKSPDGKSEVYDVSHWERALNGKALRTLHSINNGDYGGESLMFWDKKKQQVVFYYFTTADFFTQGSIEFISENEFIAYEDVSGNADGITQVKSTSQLLDDEMNVSTSYLKDGEWTKPENRTYRRSNKQVIFK